MTEGERFIRKKLGFVVVPGTKAVENYVDTIAYGLYDKLACKWSLKMAIPLTSFVSQNKHDNDNSNNKSVTVRGDPANRAQVDAKIKGGSLQQQLVDTLAATQPTTPPPTTNTEQTKHLLPLDLCKALVSYSPPPQKKQEASFPSNSVSLKENSLKCLQVENRALQIRFLEEEKERSQEYSEEDQDKQPYPVTDETTSLTNSDECLEPAFVEKTKQEIGEESMSSLPPPPPSTKIHALTIPSTNL